MARKSRRSGGEALIESIALLPWWACVALAIVSYLVLHRIAGQPLATIGPPGQMATGISSAIFRGLAIVGQYLVPILCLVAAAVSALGRRERQRLLADTAQSDAPDVLDGMSWREFEMLVGEAFRLQGYRVTETGGGGADGGVDLVLAKGNEKFLVQCKQWKAFKVGVDVVRELYGVMAAKGAAGGFVVTSGRFTADATAFAQGRNVRLVDGAALQRLIGQARASPGSGQGSREGAAAAVAPAAAAPSCPVCAKTMVMRTAKRGANAGTAFWGCVAYPACRSTRQVE
jgi:restriction system protein